MVLHVIEHNKDLFFIATKEKGNPVFYW